MNYLFTCLLLLLPFWSTAQDDYYQKRTNYVPPQRPYTILLKDGTRLQGEIISQDSVESVIRTRNVGEIRVRSDQIVQVRQQGARVATDTFPNVFAQTMRLVPTAFQAEKGRVYYRNYLLYVSQFEAGITDHWSVGGTFGFYGFALVGSLNTKLSAPISDRVRLGLSAQYIGVYIFPIFGRVEKAGVGYLQGILTTGDRQNNTSFGLGSSLTNGAVGRTLIGSFGLVRKVNPRLSFITENFVLFGNQNTSFSAMVSGGIRFDRRRHAFDLAAYVPILGLSNRSVVATLIPFGSYHLRFGR